MDQDQWSMHDVDGLARQCMEALRQQHKQGGSGWQVGLMSVLMQIITPTFIDFVYSKANQ
jgi:hypothetical protein